MDGQSAQDRVQDETTGLEGTRGAPSQLPAPCWVQPGLLRAWSQWMLRTPQGWRGLSLAWGAPQPSPGVSPEGTRGKVTP